jgi:tRNA dimethylallyltransferase
MDIGTGKVPRDFPANSKIQMANDKFRKYYFSEGVRHHLLDVASPKRNYNVTHFVRDAKKAIAGIKKQGKVPIICGGTGFWIQALLEDSPFPAVKPNPELRKKLGRLSTKELFQQLTHKDPARAETIDARNKIRLIRALEIIETLGSVPPLQHSTFNIQHSYIIIALSPSQETLWNHIETRLEKRLRKGMLAEVRRLRTESLSWKKLESFGLEYKYVALFLQKKISRKTMNEQLNFAIRHYAKRQLTWLRRFEKAHPLHWITTTKEATKFIT